MKLYSATGSFKHKRKNSSFVPQYEERTVIVQAKNIAEAERLILEEFENYCFGETTFLEDLELQEVDGCLKDGVLEVASFSRVSKLSKSKYLETFRSDLRPKDCGDKNWKHQWYTKDSKTKACYNCQKLKKKS